MDLTNEDVADILALLDSLPYDSLDLQTSSFRLTLRRTPDGWTQDSQVLSEPVVLEVGGSLAGAEAPGTATMSHRGGYNRYNLTSLRSDGGTAGTDESHGVSEEAERAGGDIAEAGGDATGAGGGGAVDRGEVHGAGVADGDGRELVAVRAPLPGTFYRAPRPGAEPFVEVGSRVSAETVVCIVETMKLMNSVHARVDGVVAEICLGNAEFAANGATLMRIEAD
jgi:biotin carboxyl carrier protein